MTEMGPTKYKYAHNSKTNNEKTLNILSSKEKLPIPFIKEKIIALILNIRLNTKPSGIKSLFGSCGFTRTI